MTRPAPSLLALESSGEAFSLALQTPAGVLSAQTPSGAAASARVLPIVSDLLAQAGIRLAALDAIAFGCGPGGFTALRSACAVAQGLALGAALPVLAVDTLRALAQDAWGLAPRPPRGPVWAVLDARMNEIYAAAYQLPETDPQQLPSGASGHAWNFAHARVLHAPHLQAPPDLAALWAQHPPFAVAGSALGAYDQALGVDALGSAGVHCVPDARPNAQALLPLASALWWEGKAVDAAFAHPVYVRDKVAQTTAERLQARAQTSPSAP